MIKIIVYGLGRNGKDFIEDVLEAKNSSEIDIVAVTDSDSQKRYIDNGQNFIDPLLINNMDYDYVVVTPEIYFNEIEAFLLEKGVEAKKIKSVREFSGEAGEHYCELCENKVLAWRHYSGDKSKPRVQCPICFALHRYRFVYYVIRKYTRLMNEINPYVLHFAPETYAEKIRLACGENYVTADIMPGKADILADITNLQFPDHKFDYIICNHVMEHIINDAKGFMEMKRVLKPEGTLVLTIPVKWDRDTLEDENIKTKEDRIRYYGQEDHVRYYGKDIVEKLCMFGFDVKLIYSDEVVSEKDIEKFGYPLNRYDDGAVFLCRLK